MVMEDKRIIKTKKNIKLTLIELLQKMSFEKITVSEICRVGETSRITFYTHYDDKYSLVDEMFRDYIKEATDDYHNLQTKNNPENNARKGYDNLLECILNLYYHNASFFSQTTPAKNPYLYSAFFQHVFENVEDYLNRHNQQIKTKYSSRQTAAFMCNGLGGVIDECFLPDTKREVVCENIRGMYRDILESPLFIGVK